MTACKTYGLKEVMSVKGGATAVTVSPSGDRSELLWKQYELHVDLYKFYLELVLKANTFFYGITGAVVSYYVTHVASSRVRLALLLPMLMSTALGGVFFHSVRLLRPVRNEMFCIRDELGLENAPDFQVLSAMLTVFGALLLIVAAGLLCLLLGVF